MSLFKTRSDYFKSGANKNKLIAHDRYVSGSAGPKRKSFFRLNNEDELIAACANWAHFPCLVHFAYSGRYTSNTGEVEKRQLTNSLLFLSKAKSTADMDSIEEAKDLSFQVMEEYISWLLNEQETEGYCSPLQNLSLGDFSFNEAGPIGATLYGWELSFADETFPGNVTNYDESKFFED